MNREFGSWFASILLVTFFQATFAHAAIVYTSQSRFTSVSASTVSGSDQSVLNALNFDNFVGDQNRFFQIGVASVRAAVTHNSSLLSTGLSLTGTLLGTTGPPAGSSIGTARSYFEVQFNLDQSELLSIDVSTQEIEFGSFTFTGAGISISDSIGLVGVPPRTTYSNLQTRQLEAGRYSIILDATNSGATMGRVGTFRLNLQVVPEPNGIYVVMLLAWQTWRRQRKA